MHYIKNATLLYFVMINISCHRQTERESNISDSTSDQNYKPKRNTNEFLPSQRKINRSKIHETWYEAWTLRIEVSCDPCFVFVLCRLVVKFIHWPFKNGNISGAKARGDNRIYTARRTEVLETQSTPITRTFKGNKEQFELSGVRVIEGKII